MKKVILILMLGLFALNVSAVNTEPKQSDQTELIVDYQDVNEVVDCVFKLPENVSKDHKERSALMKMEVSLKNPDPKMEPCKFDDRFWCGGKIRRDPPASPEIKIVIDKIE
jgi:hypothetical protein